MPRLIEMVNAIKDQLDIEKSLDMVATIDRAVKISGVKVPPVGSVYERTKFLHDHLGVTPVWSPTAAQLQRAAETIAASRRKKAATAAAKAADAINHGQACDDLLNAAAAQAEKATQSRAPDSPDLYDTQEIDALLNAAAEQVEKQLSGCKRKHGS